MNIRKTRIKKETKANGAVVYTAQYKGWIFWRTFFHWDSSLVEYYYQYCKLNLISEWDDSEQEAKNLIDFYIARVNHKNASAIENKIVKVEYEGYP